MSKEDSIDVQRSLTKEFQVLTEIHFNCNTSSSFELPCNTTRIYDMRWINYPLVIGASLLKYERFTTTTSRYRTIITFCNRAFGDVEKENVNSPQDN